MKKIVKENVIKEKKRKFSFKKYIPTGRWRSFEAQNNYGIKLDGKKVGNISEIKLRNDIFGRYEKEDEGKFIISFMINKKDPMEDNNPNCSWRWIRLKRRFENSEEAKQFVIDNSEFIQTQFDLYCLEE